MDECRDGSNPCEPTGEVCINLAGGFRCELVPPRPTTTTSTTATPRTTTTTTTTTTLRPTTTTTTAPRPTTTSSPTTTSTTTTTTRSPPTVPTRPVSNQNDRCPAGYRYSRRIRSCQGTELVEFSKETLPSMRFPLLIGSLNQGIRKQLTKTA